jgi:hypothetical protein
VRRVRLFDGRIGAVERSVEAGAMALPVPQVTTAPATGAASATAAPPAPPAKTGPAGAPGRRPSAPVRPHRTAAKR